MTTKPRICVSLKLIGQGFLPAKVTPLTKMVPTKVWRAGDSVQGTALRRREDCWEFGLPYRETYDMDALLRELLDVIDAHRDGIEQACEKFRLSKEISFRVYIRDDDMPASWFSAETLVRIAYLHASLDLRLIPTGAPADTG